MNKPWFNGAFKGPFSVISISVLSCTCFWFLFSGGSSVGSGLEFFLRCIKSDYLEENMRKVSVDIIKKLGRLYYVPFAIDFPSV